jgi:hypothetical protein
MEWKWNYYACVGISPLLGFHVEFFSQVRVEESKAMQEGGGPKEWSKTFPFLLTY